MDINEVIDVDFNVNVLCRLCTGEQNTLLPLFDGNEDLGAKIKVLSPYIQMYAGDGLPNHVCEGCVSQVNSFCEFKLMVEASDSSLRDFIRRQQERRSDPVMFIKEEDTSNEDMYTTSVVTELQTEDISQNVEDPLLIKQEQDPDMVVDVATQNVTDMSNNNEYPAEGEVSFDQKPVTSTSLPGTLLTTSISEQRLYECSTCAKKFTTFHGVKIHGRSHAETHGYECMICNRRFSTWQRFRGHRRTHTEGLGLECPLCNKKFNNERGLKVHCSRYHTDGRPFECNVCKKTFDTEHSLRIHGRIHSEERHHVCLVCKETFSTGLGLRLHSRTHTAKTFTSVVSPCSEVNSLTQYNNFSLLELPHECVYCKKRFTALKGLMGHKRFCKSKPPKEVPSMPTTFGEGLPNETPINQGCHRCPFCKKTFPEWGSLNFHVRCHKRVSRKCMICMKSFKNIRGLRSHSKVHRSIVTDSTSVVDQVALPEDSQSVFDVTFDDSCSSPSVISSNHHKMKNECSICKIVFNSARGLRTHKSKIHKQENHLTALGDNREMHDVTAEVNEGNLFQEDVPCTDCQKTFKNARALRTHKARIHKQDNQLTALGDNREMHDVTAEVNEGNLIQEDVPCTDCQKTFKNARALRTHKTRIHKQENQLTALGNNGEMHDVTAEVNEENVIQEGVSCTDCQKTYKNMCSLRTHRWRCHQDSNSQSHSLTLQEETVPDDVESGQVQGQKYDCLYCHKSFVSNRGLLVHNGMFHKMDYSGNYASTETSEEAIRDNDNNAKRDNECHICYKSFDTKAGMLIHLAKTHKGSGAEGAISPQETHGGPSGCYECKVCNKKYDKMKSFRLHCTMLQHVVPENVVQQAKDTSVDIYECPICNNNFFSRHSYHRHCLYNHKNLCSKTEASVKIDVRTPQNVKNNLKPVVQNDNFSEDSLLCVVCDRSFNSAKGLKIHYTVCHNNDHDSLLCIICDRSFNSAKGLKIHYTVCHNNDHAMEEQIIEETLQLGNSQSGFTCRRCNKLFLSERGLKIHQGMYHKNDHLNENSGRNPPTVSTENGNKKYNYACSSCDKTFCNERGVAIHRAKCHSKRHTEEMVNETPHLNQEAVSNYTNNTENRSYECSSCNKSFSSEKGRRLHHRRMHEDILVFNSSVNDGNRQVNTLNVPLPKEDGPLECLFCNNVFSNEKSLKIHCTKNHKNQLWQALYNNRSIVGVNGMISSEEPSGTSCSVCNRTFGSEEALTLHFSKNHADSPRSTAIIPVFNMRKSVDSFSHKHTNKLPYECNVCKKTFETEIGFKAHICKEHMDVGSDEYQRTSSTLPCLRFHNQQAHRELAD